MIFFSTQACLSGACTPKKNRNNNRILNKEGYTGKTETSKKVLNPIILKLFLVIIFIVTVVAIVVLLIIIVICCGH